MPLELVAFALASLGVPVAVLLIFLYVRASFELLELVQRHEPDLWNALGRPERVYLQQSQGGFHTIQPIGPWFSWTWSGSALGLHPDVVAVLARTRSRLRIGLAALAAAIGAILLLIAVAPSAG